MNIIFESEMNLPNLLTILRITIAPIIAILIWRETSHAQLIAAFSAVFICRYYRLVRWISCTQIITSISPWPDFRPHCR